MKKQLFLLTGLLTTMSASAQLKYEIKASQEVAYERNVFKAPPSLQTDSGAQGPAELYNNAIFKSFFHSTCGGHTANGTFVFDYKNITPLSGRPCPYCTKSKFYT